MFGLSRVWGALAAFGVILGGDGPLDLKGLLSGPQGRTAGTNRAGP